MPRLLLLVSWCPQRLLAVIRKCCLTAFVFGSFAASLLASPTLGGTPTTPTAAAGTMNTTRVGLDSICARPWKELGGKRMDNASFWPHHPVGHKFILKRWQFHHLLCGHGIAFPNNCFMAIVNAYGSSATAYVQSVSRTTLTAVNGISSTNSWIAIGN